MATGGKVFLDTNVLVYQFDRSAPRKQKQAQALIEQSIAEERAVISSQVVQEFMNAALNKFVTVLSPNELRPFMDQILRPLCQHLPTLDFYERSLTLYQTNSLDFYDALIIQAALDLGCGTLFSEDLQQGRQFGGMTITNPFT